MKTEPFDPVNPTDGRHLPGDYIPPNTGLTKREYFAAMALNGIIAFNGGTVKVVAEDAIMYADALISELNK